MPGACHMLHNTTESLTSELRYFEWFYVPFKTLVSLRNRREFRKKYIHECMRDEQAALLAPRLTYFHCSLVGHRWGYLISACQALADLEAVLRLTWNSSELLRGHRVAVGEAGPPRTADGGVGDYISNDDVDQAAAFVMSAAHWAYMHMLLKLTAAINSFEAFFKSCPCHPSAALASAGTWSRRSHMFRQLLRAASDQEEHGLGVACPMQGCRAPSAAAGRHWSLLEGWFAETFQELLLILIPVASAEDKHRVLTDWQAGRAKLLEELRRKFNFLDVFPYKLVGIAHPVSDVARRVARECLQQFAGGGATRAADAPVHHRLSIKFLHPASALYAQLVSFVGGASMEEDGLQGLRQAAAELKFVRLVEQSIERQHAIGKLNTRGAPRHAEAYWSLALPGRELDMHMRQDASFVAELGRSCDVVRSPHALADCFRLSGHPLFVEASEQKSRHQRLTEVLRPVVYRCDRVTQQACHASLSGDVDDARRGRVPALRPAGRPADADPLTMILRHLALEHLRKCTELASVLSCTASPGFADFQQITKRLRPQPINMIEDGLALEDAARIAAVQNEANYMADDDDIPDDSATVVPIACSLNIPTSGVDSPQHDHMFFSVLSPSPSLAKGISYGGGVCEGFRSDEMLISVLQAGWQGRDLCISDSSVSRSSDAGLLQTVFFAAIFGARRDAAVHV